MKRFLSIFAAVLFCSALLLLQMQAAVVTETVNVPYFDRNTSGDGYYWDNREKTLTLTDLYLDTTADYGMRVPGNCTVILEGENYISAAYAAMAIEGEVTIKGSGSLTLVGGTYGLYGYATSKSAATRYLATGEFKASGGKAAIAYDYAKFFAEKGSRITLSATEAGGYAITGVTVKILDCTLTADAPIKASYSLTIQNANVTVSSADGALDAIRSLSLEDVKIEAGDTLSTLSEKEGYAGEAALRLTALGRGDRGSILFGKSVHSSVDYIIFALVILLLGAAIAFPILRQRKKDKAAREAYAAIKASPVPKKDTAKSSGKKH